VPPVNPAPPPPPAADRTAPSLTVQYPPTTSFTTTASVLTVRGVAADNTGVTHVAWSSNTAGGGTAVGTKQWVADSIPLLKGTNYIIVRAFDAAGNTAWRSIVVTRR
jgi:hypothetical protein